MATASQSQVDKSRQYEGTRLAAAAYQAKAINSALSSGQSGSTLLKTTQAALIDGGFYTRTSNRFFKQIYASSCLG
jgi:hypothetical protein